MMAKFVHLFVSFVIIFLAKIGCTLTQDDDKWSQQFLEMKVMITTLGTKISSLESRMSDLKIIEFASTVINMDSEAKTVNNRLDNMQNQLDIIKNAVAKIPSSATCPESIPSGNPAKEVEERAINLRELSTITAKLDDYGRKMMQSLKDVEKKTENSSTTLLSTVRSGFNKVIDKMESTLTMDDQVLGTVRNIQQIIVPMSGLGDQISELSDNFKFHQSMSENQLFTVQDTLGKMIEIFNGSSSRLKESVSEIELLKSKLIEGSNLTQHTMGNSENESQETDQLKELVCNLTFTVQATGLLCSKTATLEILPCKEDSNNMERCRPCTTNSCHDSAELKTAIAMELRSGTEILAQKIETLLTAAGRYKSELDSKMESWKREFFNRLEEAEKNMIAKFDNVVANRWNTLQERLRAYIDRIVANITQFSNTLMKKLEDVHRDLYSRLSGDFVEFKSLKSEVLHKLGEIIEKLAVIEGRM